jgi:hypothetical protein
MCSYNELNYLVLRTGLRKLAAATVQQEPNITICAKKMKATKHVKPG